MPLLEPAQLFQAISGRFTSAVPLVGWARELGDLHAELLPLRLGQGLSPGGFDCEHVRGLIDKVVGEIDSWAEHNIPRTKCARKHTHSLGEVISHIAHTYVEAWWMVLHSADVELRHLAWFHLGEAREGYREMVNEIRARHLQLPLGTSAIRRGRVGWEGSDGARKERPPSPPNSKTRANICGHRKVMGTHWKIE